eukprot:CAMPEP_0170520934 /NCGR_PEP_ID=MMETSP0209-20121228/6257_1 /TAXON_ID=665100 ORGANISM="Litonotus pictus, Strain P1" /NCGR_SAMPLE_ID=MMETSP0209 /ASSEMBLY_ACC=CAM_ASM_000301 /LENGTH=1355 /DNA_ID=CAMNT_0010807523 /DNA_START=1109 /DNA_END=5176 /DNA_ORIENTATION=-
MRKFKIPMHTIDLALKDNSDVTPNKNIIEESLGSKISSTNIPDIKSIFSSKLAEDRDQSNSQNPTLTLLESAIQDSAIPQNIRGEKKALLQGILDSMQVVLIENINNYLNTSKSFPLSEEEIVNSIAHYISEALLNSHTSKQSTNTVFSSLLKKMEDPFIQMKPLITEVMSFLFSDFFYLGKFHNQNSILRVYIKLVRSTPTSDNYFLESLEAKDYLIERIDFLIEDFTGFHFKETNKLNSLKLSKYLHDFKSPLLLINDIVSNLLEISELSSDFYELPNTSHTLNENKTNYPSKNTHPKWDSSNVPLQTHRKELLNERQTLSRNNILNLQQLRRNLINELEGLKSASEYMNEIIELVNDYTIKENKIEITSNDNMKNKRSVEKKPIDLRIVMNSVRNFFETKIRVSWSKHRKINFDVFIDPEIPDTVNLDEISFKQILHNLLSNALKFTYKGFIAVKMIITERKTLLVSVEDSGVGIKKEELARLGKPFELSSKGNANTVRSRISKDPTGSGLGISIVKDLLDKYDASLMISSEYGTGSVFSFELDCNISNKDLLLFKRIPLRKSFKQMIPSPCKKPKRIFNTLDIVPRTENDRRIKLIAPNKSKFLSEKRVKKRHKLDLQSESEIKERPAFFSCINITPVISKFSNLALKEHFKSPVYSKSETANIEKVISELRKKELRSTSDISHISSKYFNTENQAQISNIELRNILKQVGKDPSSKYFSYLSKNEQPKNLNAQTIKDKGDLEYSSNNSSSEDSLEHRDIIKANKLTFKLEEEKKYSSESDKNSGYPELSYKKVQKKSSFKYKKHMSFNKRKSTAPQYSENPIYANYAMKNNPKSENGSPLNSRREHSFYFNNIDMLAVSFNLNEPHNASSQAKKNEFKQKRKISGSEAMQSGKKNSVDSSGLDIGENSGFFMKNKLYNSNKETNLLFTEESDSPTVIYDGIYSVQYSFLVEDAEKKKERSARKNNNNKVLDSMNMKRILKKSPSKFIEEEASYRETRGFRKSSNKSLITFNSKIDDNEQNFKYRKSFKSLSPKKGNLGISPGDQESFYLIQPKPRFISDKIFSVLTFKKKIILNKVNSNYITPKQRSKSEEFHNLANKEKHQKVHILKKKRSQSNTLLTNILRFNINSQIEDQSILKKEHVDNVCKRNAFNNSLIDSSRFPIKKSNQQSKNLVNINSSSSNQYYNSLFEFSNSNSKEMPSNSKIYNPNVKLFYVLIIEDEYHIYKAYQRLIDKYNKESTDFEIVCFLEENPLAALSLIYHKLIENSIRINLIISDDKLPFMSGIKFCNLFKESLENDCLYPIDFVLVSGHNYSDVSYKEMLRNFSEVFSKPMNYSVMKELLNCHKEKERS